MVQWSIPSPFVPWSKKQVAAMILKALAGSTWREKSGKLQLRVEDQPGASYNDARSERAALEGEGVLKEGWKGGLRRRLGTRQRRSFVPRVTWPFLREFFLFRAGGSNLLTSPDEFGKSLGWRM